MRNKKYTVNERLVLVERMTMKLALEIQNIMDAINKAAETSK